MGELDGRKAMAELKSEGHVTVESAGETFQLTEEQLIIETGQVEGFAVESEGELTVALDLKLTEALLDEGFVREIISKLQNMRKDADFEVSDRIDVWYSGSSRIESVFANYSDEIAGEVLAVSLTKGEAPEAQGKDWTLNGEPCRLAVAVHSA